MEPLLIELIQGDFLTYKKISIKTRKNHIILNPQEILLDLKQQIKLFGQIKDLRNFKICLYIEDNYIKDMLELTKKEINNENIVICSSSDLSYLKKGYSGNVVVVIGKVSHNAKKFFVDNNIFIISILDIENKVNNDCIYRVKGSFKTIKKIVWFVSLLDLVIKN